MMNDLWLFLCDRFQNRDGFNIVYKKGIVCKNTLILTLNHRSALNVVVIEIR